MDGRLVEPEVGQEDALLLAGELGYLGLDDRRDPADASSGPTGDRFEPEALDQLRRLADRLLVEVQTAKDRLLRQEGIASNRPRLVGRQRDGP